VVFNGIYATLYRVKFVLCKVVINVISWRMLSAAERHLALELWQYCFNDPPAFARWYFDRRAGDVFAQISSEHTLAAQLVCVPINISLRGAAANAVILSGVAVAPEYRRQGRMNGLMREGLRFLRQRGAAFAALYPFDYNFYRRYGFAQCGEVARIKAELTRLPAFKASGEITRWSAGTLTDAAEPTAAAKLAEAYEACFASYSGHALRDEPAMALRLEELALEDGHAVLYTRDNRPEGYLLYRIQDKKLFVDEIGAACRAARESLLGYLAGHASTASSVEIICPADDPLIRMLPDARGLVNVEPYDMLRVVDIENIGGVATGDDEVFLSVTDEYAPWNEGVWRFRGSGGVLKAQRVGGVGSAVTPPRIPIGALTQWILGYANGDELARAKEAMPPETVRAMEVLLPKQSVFLYEMC
jgi:predicted acetyltransferase